MLQKLSQKLGIIAMVAVASVTLTTIVRSEPPSTGGPPGAARLNEDQYRNIIADTFGADIKVAGRFPPGIRIDGLLAIGDGAASITPSTMEQYAAVARTIAAQVTDKEHRDRLEGCKPASPKAVDNACIRAFVANYGRRLFRRALTPAETSAFAGVAVAAAKSQSDYYVGLEYALATMSLAPEFLFI